MSACLSAKGEAGSSSLKAQAKPESGLEVAGKREGKIRVVSLQRSNQEDALSSEQKPDILQRGSSFSSVSFLILVNT